MQRGRKGFVPKDRVTKDELYDSIHQSNKIFLKIRSNHLLSEMLNTMIEREDLFYCDDELIHLIKSNYNRPNKNECKFIISDFPGYIRDDQIAITYGYGCHSNDYTCITVEDEVILFEDLPDFLENENFRIIALCGITDQELIFSLRNVSFSSDSRNFTINLEEMRERNLRVDLDYPEVFVNTTRRDVRGVFKTIFKNTKILGCRNIIVKR